MIAVFLLLLGGLLAAEAWGFMLFVGMVHIHLLDAVQVISYGVAWQFVLVSLPLQGLYVLLSLMENVDDW